MAFQAEYTPLRPAHPEWGTVACLPWDEAIFGFPVADLRGATLAPPYELRSALEAFAAATGTELISTRLNALDSAGVAALCAAGFVPVDLSIQASQTRLQPERLPLPRFGVRLATPADTEDLLRIAGSAFAFGRYHTDARFPRVLANRRYVCWLRNALASTDPAERVFVLGAADQCLGFFHAVLCDGEADLRLAAGDPASRAPLGLALYAETVLALQAMGAQRYVTKVSAANMGVMNIYASMGFRFSSPEQILHWHAPGPRHLV